VKELTQLIAKDLQLNLSEMEFPDEDVLRDFLRKQIGYLMDKEFNKLINIFYRLDIDEKKVKEVLTLASPESIVDELVSLVLEREKLKIYYRQKYQ